MEPWTFGEAPLPAVVELAEVLRDLTSTVLSLERTSPELEELTRVLRDAQARLAGSAPADPAPRVGDHPTDDQRVYVDHSREELVCRERPRRVMHGDDLCLRRHELQAGAHRGGP